MERPSVVTVERDEADEPALIARVRAGDRGAFEGLFHAYYPLLHAFVTSYVRAPDVAEEIVQDVFLNIWVNRTTWTVRDGIRSYLYGSARNRALSYLRHEGVTARWEMRAATESEHTVPSSGDTLEATEWQALVARAIDRLPARRRMAYLLRWQHRMSYAEIAEQMGISVKGVEVALAKALQTLRDDLKDYWA